jgi:hypothetical protein
LITKNLHGYRTGLGDTWDALLQEESCGIHAFFEGKIYGVCEVKFNVFSDNPALILAEVMTKLNYVESNEDFWQSIAILADYCDQRI